MRWLVVFGLIGVFGCNRKGDAEPAPAEAGSQPAASSEAPPAPVLTWALTVQEVQYADGNLTLLAGLAQPTADLPEAVWLGASARKPDGTVVDGPLTSGAPDALGTAVNLTHAFGPGFTEVAVGLWSADPACPEDSEQPCPSRLDNLGDALAAWPAQDGDGPTVFKIDREIGVAFVEAGAEASVVRVARAATIQALAARFGSDHGFDLSAHGSSAGDPADGIRVRHRDPSDAVAAEAVAAELRTAFTGVAVDTAHAPDLVHEFSVVLGGEGAVADGYSVRSEPVRMVRPGLSDRSRKRLDKLDKR